MTSNKSEAKAFKKLVTSEVLPSIRKTGQYTHAKAKPKATLEPIEAALSYAPKISKGLDWMLKGLGIKGAERVAVVNKFTENHTGVNLAKLAGVNIVVSQQNQDDRWLSVTELALEQGKGLYARKLNLELLEAGL